MKPFLQQPPHKKPNTGNRIVLLIIIAGLLLPQRFSMPVKGATTRDYHPETFWYYPWGKSVTHKGADIFAKEGTPVQAATAGLVLYRGQISMGGNVVVILGAKWRLHYYAHLQTASARPLSWASRAETIGAVGATGNAAGKAPHLHYTIFTLIPYVWRIDTRPQGWKKMFYLNPLDYLKGI